MGIVLFHSGQLPGFLECTFRQIRKFNDVKVYFLTDKEWLKNPLFDKYSIITVDKANFYSHKVRSFERKFNYPPDHFWTLAATRLIYIENFLKQGLEDVYHFENDVLLYYDLSEHHETFKRLYKLGITPGGRDKCMTGFMFIKNWEVLADMTAFFIRLLKTHGVTGIKDKYRMDMVNEMTLMKLYAKEYLPILPFGEFSNNFSEFNSIFDPASWGQFVGGTRKEGPGAKPQDHYIGQLLIQNPDYKVEWKDKIPYFQGVKINNLHIHSKNLHKYMSND